MMIFLEPELEDGVNEGVDVPVFLYNVLLDQRLLIPADGLRCAKGIPLIDILCTEMVFSVGNGNQHVDLRQGEAINVSLKDRGVGVDKQDSLLLKYLFRHCRLGSIHIKKLNCWTYQL